MTTKQEIVSRLQNGPLEPFALWVYVPVGFDTLNRNLGELMDNGSVIEIIENDRVMLAIDKESQPADI